MEALSPDAAQTFPSAAAADMVKNLLKLNTLQIDNFICHPCVGSMCKFVSISSPEQHQRQSEIVSEQTLTFIDLFTGGSRVRGTQASLCRWL